MLLRVLFGHFVVGLYVFVATHSLLGPFLLTTRIIGAKFVALTRYKTAQSQKGLRIVTQPSFFIDSQVESTT